jgi:group I intron endonuclease
MVGIYKITNKINGKIYVGQSNNIKRRFWEHQNRGTASRIPVDAAIEKHGSENF